MKLNEMKRTIFNNSAGRPKLLKNSEIPLHSTKGELVEAYGIDFTFDFAIPNDWAGPNVSRSEVAGGMSFGLMTKSRVMAGFPGNFEAFHVIQKTNESLAGCATRKRFRFLLHPIAELMSPR